MDLLIDKAVISKHWVGTHIISKWPDALEEVFPQQLFTDAQNEISCWEGYAPTPLHELDELAGASSVSKLHYKDESQRFGLGSFKALGGAYAVLVYLSQTLSERFGRSVSLQDIREGKYKQEAENITVVTATDGNHGRSVAWGAMQAGCNCRIYIHAEVSIGRELAMRAYGAEIIRIAGDYDESVRLCAREATANDWMVISDTTYEGYQDIPRYVMAGYSIMVKEVLKQLETPPTHIIVQAGVGGLAASMCASLWIELDENRPRLIVMESKHADCVMKSMEVGKASNVEIEEETIMAGLSCGDISLLAWEILKVGASAVVTLSDEAVAPTMRYMANIGIEAGESGVPGIISLLAISKDEALRKKLAINDSSRVLVLGCEGATDPKVYNDLINGDAA